MIDTALQADSLDFVYGETPVLRGVTLRVGPGERVALLGRNGAGKSTLLRLLSGTLAPTGGGVTLGGTALDALNRRAVARQMAVVPQDVRVPFAFTVREVVALGRTAHIPFLHGESRRDREAVERALRLLRLDEMAERPYTTLSGGEQQRVVLAMAVAQEPRVLLLDEPTVHLDVAHQVEALRLTRLLNREQGVTILAAVHDLNLAALFFERLLLLKDGRIVADGPPEVVLTADAVADVFGAAVAIYRHPTANVPQVTLLP